MLALICLALHRVISAHFFRRQAHNDIETELVIVVLAESLKGSFCFAAHKLKRWRERRTSSQAGETDLDEQALLEVSVSSETETENEEKERTEERIALKLVVPASLLIVQNILFVMSAEGLQPAIFQACWQFRIISTASFSAIVLRDIVSVQQWCALLAVVLGILTIYLPTFTTTDSPSMPSSTASFFFLLTAATLGGLALVLIQRVLRQSKIDPSLLLIYVSCISLVILTPAMLFVALYGQISIARVSSLLLPASMLAILQILNTYCIAQSGAIAVNVAGAISIPLSKILEMIAAHRVGDTGLFTNASLLVGTIAIGYGSHSFLASKSKVIK